ncbi:MAG: hypothetical protein QJR13_01745 [Bacillota bacterium]|nr:hypothetical protein [Bacillota bacterium]
MRESKRQEIVLEASQGCTKKPGDRVAKGEKLGVLPGRAGTAWAPFAGVIRQIGFSSEDHTLKVLLEADVGEGEAGGGAGERG